MSNLKEIWCNIYTPKVNITFVSQRDNSTKVFGKGEILLQVEGINGTIFNLRGKYPNDAYFITTTFDTLEVVKK